MERRVKSKAEGGEQGNYGEKKDKKYRQGEQMKRNMVEREINSIAGEGRGRKDCGNHRGVRVGVGYTRNQRVGVGLGYFGYRLHSPG